MPGITLERELQLLITKLDELASYRPASIHAIGAKFVRVNGIMADIARINRLITERNNRSS